MPNIQVRDVPDEVHRKLKSRAALAGQSLNDFLLARMTELASLPTIPELAERIGQLERFEDDAAIAAIIREDRDNH